MIDLPGHRTGAAGAHAAARAAADRAGRPLRARRHDALTGTESFINNPVTSDPVRFARNAAILEEDPTLGIGSPTVAWADTAFATMRDFRRRFSARRSASRS